MMLAPIVNFKSAVVDCVLNQTIIHVFNSGQLGTLALTLVYVDLTEVISADFVNVGYTTITYAGMDIAQVCDLTALNCIVVDTRCVVAALTPAQLPVSWNSGDYPLWVAVGSGLSFFSSAITIVSFLAYRFGKVCGAREIKKNGVDPIELKTVVGAGVNKQRPQFVRP